MRPRYCSTLPLRARRSPTSALTYWPPWNQTHRRVPEPSLTSTLVGSGRPLRVREKPGEAQAVTVAITVTSPPVASSEIAVTELRSRYRRGNRRSRSATVSIPASLSARPRFEPTPRTSSIAVDNCGPFSSSTCSLPEIFAAARFARSRILEVRPHRSHLPVARGEHRGHPETWNRARLFIFKLPGRYPERLTGGNGSRYIPDLPATSSSPLHRGNFQTLATMQRPSFAQFLTGSGSRGRPIFLFAYCGMWLHLVVGIPLLIVKLEVPPADTVSSMAISSLSAGIILYGILSREYGLLVTLVPYGLGMARAFAPETRGLDFLLVAIVIAFGSGHRVLSSEYRRYRREIYGDDRGMPLWITALAGAALVLLFLYGIRPLL